MNAASTARYPAAVLRPPEPLYRAVVCATSNELATNGCERARAAYAIDLPAGRVPRTACHLHAGDVLAERPAVTERKRRSVPDTIFRSFRRFFGGD
jgi:penicillin-binding protein 1A